MDEVTADQALRLLMEGNTRYVAAKVVHPNQDGSRRREVAGAQHPFAVILGCSDSRVPPEILFDQGIGDLFVVRVAGNVAGPDVLGSIEYAGGHLGVALVMVLGHSGSGAVRATVKGDHAEGHAAGLLEAIVPALERARGKSGDLAENTATENVKLVMSQIEQSRPVLAELVSSGKLRVVGARYDLDSGRVELLG
jgi:carbonic anhydrase